jgi:two-component system response regulator NreC
VSVTLILADDHPIVRQGLRHLLEKEPKFLVVGETGNGIEALQLVEQLKPDILIVDMMMPGLNGLEILRQLKKISPKTRSIVLSMQSANAYVVEALKNGAAGYVLKETGPVELINAVDEVIQGRRFLSAKISKRFLATGLEGKELVPDPYDTLTTREREVFQMTVEGLTSQEIGETLNISPRTVEIHRSNLSMKLGIKNQADLIRFAIRRGILPMDG